MIARIVLHVVARVAARLIVGVRRRPVAGAVVVVVLLAGIGWRLGAGPAAVPLATTGPIDDRVVVTVRQVVRNPATNGMALVLQEDAGPRYLILSIGEAEANAIALKLAEQAPPRPLTADVLVSVIDRLGAQVKWIEVNGAASSFYTARLLLQTANGVVEIDCRPSDCIAVALRAGAPIYVARTIIDTSGVMPSDLK